MKYCPPDLPRSVTEHLIDEWVRGKRKRALLKDVYFDELTIESLAEKYSVSESTIKRNLSDAHRQLRTHLTPNWCIDQENITDK